MVASVRLESGMLDAVVMGDPSGLGVTKVVRHPKTGVSFEGFPLPFWGKACELVKSAASKFLPIRTIGWDVALTPTGPVILEGNMWWHPDHHNAHRQMNRLLHVHGNEEKRNVVWPALPGVLPLASDYAPRASRFSEVHDQNCGATIATGGDYSIALDVSTVCSQSM